MEYIDPQKARQERERQERERQARIKAEKDRKAKIEAEKKRQAKIEAEKKRKAKLKAEKEAAQKAEEEATKKAKKAEHPDKKPTDPKLETQKLTEQKPENKKPQSEKKPDDKTQTEITWSKPGEASPIYGSSAPTYSSISSLYGQPSVPISKESEPKPKPEVPSDRKVRTWSGEKIEPKPEHKPYKPRDLSGIKQEIAEGRAQKEQKKQEQLQNTLQHYPGIQNILQQPSFFNGSLALGTTLTNPLMGATLLSGTQTLGQPEKTHPSEPIKVASAHGHGIIVPATPEQQLHHQFEIDVAAKAQRLLKANKDHLNIEQKAYAQDNNPKSDRWSHLWQVAAQRREFQTQQANLQQQLEFTTKEINNLSDMADGTGLMSTPGERQNSPKHQRLLALTQQKSRLKERIAVTKQMQVSLAYAYPALSAVKGETGANPEDIKRVQSRLPQEFDGIRGNIDNLSGEIKKDPSTALLFDSVVLESMRKGGYDRKQRHEISSFLVQERENKERLSQLGQAVGGSLFLASLVPPLRTGASLMRWLGAGVTGTMFAHDLPDLMMLDMAAQAGRGGAGNLTGQSPEQARFNLVMGYGNVALAGLDLGMEGVSIWNLARVAGRMSTHGVQVSRQVWSQVMSLSRHESEGIEKARALLMKTKGMAKEKVDEVMEIVGVPGQSAVKTTEENIKDAKALQSTTTARASGTAHVLEDYANASKVKSFIGTKVDPNHLPEGYLYGKIPTGKDALGRDIYREVVYIPKPGKTTVPLKVENGRIEMGAKGEYRIVDGKAYPKNVETIAGQPGKILGGDSQVHHLFADNMLRSTPFGQRALRLGAVNPDGSMNLIELANSTENLEKARAAHRNVQFSDFVHNTQHKDFDGLMQEVVNLEIRDLRDAKGLSRMKREDFIQQMTKEEIKEVWAESLSRMRRGLMNEDKALYKQIKKRPNSGSLAQGESQDNSEVA